MASCQSPGDCSDHGDCQDSVCVCDFAWFGDHCEESARETWGYLWTASVIVGSIMFFSLGTAAGYKLAGQLKAHKAIGPKRLFRRLFRTPKYQTLAALTLIGLLRGLWLVIDPHRFRELTSRLCDRLLYLSVSPLVFLIYCSIILVWNGICRGIGLGGGSAVSHYVRIGVYTEMVFAFPVIGAMGVTQGLRSENIVVKWILLAMGCGGVVSVVGLIAVYARLIHKYIRTTAEYGKEEEEEDEEEDNTFQRDKMGGNIRTMELERQTELMEVPSFSRDIGWESNIVGSRDALFTEGKDSELDIFPVTSVHSRPSIDCWSTYQSRQQSTEIRLHSPSETSILDKKEEECEKPLLLTLTPDDRMTLRQIIMLSALSGSIGIAGIILTLVFNSLPLQPSTTLIADVVSFSMELFAFASVHFTQVLILFTTEIQVESKQNLQFMVELSLKFQANPPSVSLPSDLPLISNRLRAYIGLQ